VWQVLQEAWDPTCAERRDGVRPQRSAHQAVGQAQASIRDGDTGVGDLEQCCDRVHHEGWLRRGRRRVQDRRVLTLIHRLLNAGVLPLEGRVEPTAEGTPHGGPRSPLRAHRLRDERDTELEQRGHRFARYADEANSDGQSRQAAAAERPLEAMGPEAVPGYRELRTRGVGRQLAWNTVTSAHGPWRLRQSPALAIALSTRYFAALGLPSLIED
jgi:hypothetical protein